MSPTPPSPSVAEPTTGVPAVCLKTSPASPKDAMNEVPNYIGDYLRDYDEDDGWDDDGDGTRIRDDGMHRTGVEDYGVRAGATSVIGTKGKATEKRKFGPFTEEVSRYDEDYDEDEGGFSPGKRNKNEGEYDSGSAEDRPIGGTNGKGNGMATDKRTSKGDTKEIPRYDEGYGEDDHEDDSDSTEDTPAVGPKWKGKGKGKGKATDKRKFGGSSKGRKCYRWTPKQEKAAIAEMLQIRAEGEILGDACFEELYKRLLSKDPAWNHSVSGIHNAWHRRDLVQYVIRAEAKAKQEKRQQQAKEDKELGLAFRSKRPLKRKSATKSAIPAKYERGDNATDEETDVESMFFSKRRRTDSPRTFTGTNLRDLDTTFSCDLSAPNVFTSPATTSSDHRVLDFPTVTIGFKRHNNSSRRTREFAEVNTMNRFWNQVVATPMFNNLGTAFMVVSVWVGAAQKPHYMAQHDKVDYADFVRLVGKAVDASGEEEVVVNVTAAL
jgi:hypothetical protein